MEQVLSKDVEFFQINQLYDECLNYLQSMKNFNRPNEDLIKDNNEKKYNFNKNYEHPEYETIQPKDTIELADINTDNYVYEELSKLEKPISYEDITIKPNHVMSNRTKHEEDIVEAKNNILRIPNIGFKVENELLNESTNSLPVETKSERLRRISEQLPKIIITKSNSTIELNNRESIKLGGKFQVPKQKKKPIFT